METLYRKMLFPSLGVNGSLSRSIGPVRQRMFSTTRTLRASKKSKPKSKPKPKPPQKKPLEKPLEYKARSQPHTEKRPLPPPPPPKPEENVLRYRMTPLILLGLPLAGMTAYITYLWISLSRPSTKPINIKASTQQDVTAQYDKIAKTFDTEVDWMETTMRIKALRSKLAYMAKGDVLEVSIGTGRNLEYYDWDFKGYGGVGKVDRKGEIKRGKVRSFTAIDKSPEMLEVAHQKFSKMFPGILGVRWVIADASIEEKIPPPPKNANERSVNLENKKYDTVIQTMGLCSVADPVALLKTLGNVVKEEEGRILLLEHGRGNWWWLNDVLDKTAEAHAREFGCWWNRDIGEIVRESGLEVVEVWQPKWWHAGTTWWVELKKPKEVSGKEGMLQSKKTEEKGEQCSDCCAKEEKVDASKKMNPSSKIQIPEPKKMRMITEADTECSDCCKNEDKTEKAGVEKTATSKKAEGKCAGCSPDDCCKNEGGRKPKQAENEKGVIQPEKKKGWGWW